MSMALLELTEKLVPISDFSQGKAGKIENIRLLKLAERRSNSNTTSFEEFVSEQGFSMEELEELSESVEFE